MAEGSTLAGALADTSNLKAFEGKKVRRASIEIPNAAGGLRDAMRIEPREFMQGDRVFLVMECIVEKVRFQPIDKEEPAGDQERVHVFSAEVATFVDKPLVAKVLAAQRDAIEKAKDEAAGRQRLPLNESDDPQAGDKSVDAAKPKDEVGSRRRSKKAAPPAPDA